MLLLQSAIVFIASFGNSIVALYVLIKNPRRLLHQGVFIFGFGASIWSAGIILLTPTAPQFLGKIIFLAGAAITLGLFVISSTLSGRNDLTKTEWFALLPVSFLFLSTFAGWTIKGIRPEGIYVGAIFGPAAPIFFSITIFYISWSILRVTKTCWTLPPIRRLPIQYFLFGIIFTSCCIVMFDIILPLFGNSSLNRIGALSVFVSVGFTAYAIVHHQLMDIKIVIQRSIIYSILSAILAGCYLTFITFLGIFLPHDVNSISIGALLTTIVGITTTPRLERYFKKITDKVFFKHKYDYAEALQQLSECASSTIDIGLLISSCSHLLSNILKTEGVRFIPASTKINEGEILVIPIRLEGQLLYNLCLKRKRSGDLYTQEDTRLLETFALQAAIAFGRANLYEQVKQYAINLEEKVDQRTYELKQVQESQKQLMLDLSHTLQTPLTVLQTKLESLRKLLPNDRQIQSLEDSLAELSLLINDLLRLARLENEPVWPHSSFDLSIILKDLVEELKIIAAHKGISIEVELSSRTYISGDATKIREVLINLVSNSIKYMRSDGERNIRFLLERQLNDAILTITDTGIGIRKGDLPKIFERFWRSSEVENRVGSGLGLSVAKYITERHGGSIAATSIWGQGTTIVLRLPLTL